jgi:hypothetical protein
MFGHFRRLEIKCKFTVLEENHRMVCDKKGGNMLPKKLLYTAHAFL